MKILHILSDGPSSLADEIISVHSKEHEVKVVDFTKGDVSYDALVDDIFTYDRVLSW
jgi:hypothetical protein